MEFVFAGAVGEKGIVGATELGDKIAQREDEAEDELLVIVVGEGLTGDGGGRGVAGARGSVGAGESGRGRGVSGGFGAGGGRGCDPTARVDTFGMAIEDVEAVKGHDGEELRGRYV